MRVSLRLMVLLTVLASGFVGFASGYSGPGPVPPPNGGNIPPPWSQISA